MLKKRAALVVESVEHRSPVVDEVGERTVARTKLLDQLDSLVALDKFSIGQLLNIDDLWEIVLKYYSGIGGRRRGRTRVRV